MLSNYYNSTSLWRYSKEIQWYSPLCGMYIILSQQQNENRMPQARNYVLTPTLASTCMFCVYPIQELVLYSRNVQISMRTSKDWDGLGIAADPKTMLPLLNVAV